MNGESFVANGELEKDIATAITMQERKQVATMRRDFRVKAACTSEV